MHESDKLDRSPLARGEAKLPRRSMGFDPVVVDEEDRKALRTFLQALDRGANLQISGSPFSSIAGLLVDILEVLPRLLFSTNFDPNRNPDLKFAEELEADEGDELEYQSVERLTSFEKKHLPKGVNIKQAQRLKDFQYKHLHEDHGVFYSPIGEYRTPGSLTKQSSGRYYASVDDKGNPLQITIPFPSDVTFNSRDKGTLSKFFTELTEVFLHLSTGQIDWRFIKLLRRYYATTRKPESKNQSAHNAKSYFYNSRKKIQKGTHSKKVNK